MEWIVLVVDLIDEMVEFVNLAFAAVLEPIIGLIQAGNPEDIINIWIKDCVYLNRAILFKQIGE